MQHRRPTWGRAALAALVMLACAAGRAAAENIEMLDPSARAGGMGGASTALSWGGTPNLWANPALATAQTGFGLQATAEDLLPGVAPDLRFHTARFTASFAGLAYTSSGRPFGAVDLDYGTYPGTLVPGFSGDERMWADGFGVSAAGFADLLAAATGHRTRLSDWGDVAWGRQWKRMRMDLAGQAPHASSWDEGWLVRVAPYDSRRASEPPAGGLRAELAYGHAVLDADPAALMFIGFLGPSSAPLWRMRRDGGALRLAWYGPERGAEPGAALTEGFRGGLGPLVEVSLAYDRETTERPGVDGTRYRVSHYGLEATWLRVLTTRFGYVDDPDGYITKPTWGLGAYLPLSRNGEVRYDFASVPQSYPRRVYRHQVAVRVDPLTRWFGTPTRDGAN